MKLSRLFVLSAMGLVSLTAGAADLIERTAPTPEDVVETPVAFEEGKTYILYNTGAGMYFTQGSTWSTRGCVVPNKVSAVAVRVAKYKINDVWDGKTYEIPNYVTNRTSYSWYKACMNESGDLYLDQTTWGNRFYEIKDQGGNVYRLMPNEVNSDIQSDGTQFVGYAGLAYDSSNDGAGFDDATERVPLTALTTENVDWVFYAFDAFDAYDKSTELKSLILRAEEAGINVDAAVSVYNNEGASYDQIVAAIAALQDAIASSVDFSGTAENPSNVTSLIENPNFDGASAAGWSGNTPGWGVSGQNAAEVPEFWQATFDTYQDLGGMAPGVYRLDMNGFYRSGGAGEAFTSYTNGENYIVKLYAQADGDKLTTEVMNPFDIQNKTSFAGDKEWGIGASESSAGGFLIPNDPSCARAYFEQGFYLNTVFFYVGDDKAARVGVFKDGDAITNDWFAYDNFKLQYFGNTAASFGKWVELSAPSFEGAMVTTSLLEDYTTLVNNSIQAATDKASAISALEPIKVKAAELKANSALWAQWLAALNDALQYTTGEYSGLAKAEELDGYVNWDCEEQKENPTWTNDEIQTSIELIAEMVQAVKDEKMNVVAIGEDVTNLYIGADDATFKNGKGGWTLEGNCNFGAGGAEAYNQKFDLYKEIASVNAAGVYELKLNGFFRLQRDQAAYDMYNNNEQVATYAWIYMNDVKSYVQCVFSEAVPNGVFANGDPATDGQYWTYTDGETTNWYANTMTSAVECFNHDMYQVKAYGLVANAGDPLRIGIAGDMTQADGPSGKGANWMMWDNFKLTYVGYDAATIREILVEAIANMPSLDDPMGKSVYNAAAAAKAAGNTALGGNDGMAMFEALKDIWAAEANIASSVALFKQLKSALEGLEEMFNEATNENAITEASEFKETVQSNIDDHVYEDADVPGLLQQIKGFRYMMRMPAEIVADTDLTAVLESPEYSNNAGEATSEGWEGTKPGTNADVMNAEVYNITPFDHYQEIPGLPTGTYKVTVMAYYRAGSATADYASYVEDATANNNAVLYANDQTQPLVRLAQFADGAHAGETDWVEVADGSGLYVPNMMSTAATLFDEQGDLLVNTVYAYIENGETLRLGLKKEEGVENDWCLFDNWTLTYVSNENVVPVSGIKGDVNGDGSVDVADISAIISVMAGTAQYADADVNNDGTVDVADISSVISIMAASARAAQPIEE